MFATPLWHLQQRVDGTVASTVTTTVYSPYGASRASVSGVYHRLAYAGLHGDLSFWTSVPGGMRSISRSFHRSS